jgi:hypothetical protein
MASTVERLAAQMEPIMFETGANTMPITTLAEVKSYLGLTDSTYDSFIEANIPRVENTMLIIRNIPWDTDELGNTVYPPGSDAIAAEMIGYKIKTKKSSGDEVSSESIDSYSVSFNSSQSKIEGYPVSIVGDIERFADGSGE